MKTKIILTGLLALIICSCTTPGYLPSSDKIDINQYGSYVHIIRNTMSNVDGELISIDSNRIVVLEEYTYQCIPIPITDVKSFKLQYAKSKHYGWTIPVYTLATLGHGLVLIFTAPINLIVTISVTASGKKTFKYSDKNMTYDQLKMFARFPQGIPANIKIASIN